MCRYITDVYQIMVCNSIYFLGDAFTSIHWRALVCTWRHTIGSDLEKRSASRRLSQEMCSSTRDEGVPDGTAAGGGYPAIAHLQWTLTVLAYRNSVLINFGRG